jgi:hypothetical protein
MSDPETLIRSMPKESPPTEVVVAALRVFRYRAIVAVFLSVGLVLSAFILKSKIDEDSRLLERIGQIRYTTGGTIAVNELRAVDGANVMLWEVVVDGTGSSYVHVLAWDERGRDFTLAISNAQVDGRATTLGAIEGSGGGAARTHVDLWQEVRAPDDDPEELTFEVKVEGQISGSVPFRVRI